MNISIDNPKPVAVASVRVTYSDGKQQHAQFRYGSDEVECEMLGPSGEVLNAGTVNRQELADDIRQEILGGPVGNRVTELLKKMGIDAEWEYPGFISIPTVDEEVYYALGNINQDWMGHLDHVSGDDENLSELGEWESGIDSKSEDVRAIALSIANHVTRAEATKGDYALKVTGDCLMRAFNFAMEVAGLIPEDTDLEVESENLCWKLCVLWGWDPEQDKEASNYLLKATLEERLAYGKERVTKLWAERGLK